MNNDKRIFSFVALGLFLAALLFPFIIAMFARDELALGFSAVAGGLALLFGTLSWSERIGKVVTLSLCALLCIAGATVVLLMPWQIARANAEQERAIAQQQRAVAEAIRRTNETTTPEK